MDTTSTVKHISDWISLEAGQSYYILGKYGEWTSMEHFTVSVEINPTDGVNQTHPLATTTMQQIAMDQINTNEQWSLTISSADTGSYKLNFLNPTTKPASYWQSEAVKANANAGGFKSAIIGYYSKFFGTDIDVTLQMFDATSTLTTDSTQATTYFYTVSVRKMINGYSINAATITKVDSKSTFTVVPPIKGVKSSAPVNGTYAITCTDD